MVAFLAQPRVPLEELQNEFEALQLEGAFNPKDLKSLRGCFVLELRRALSKKLAGGHELEGKWQEAAKDIVKKAKELKSQSNPPSRLSTNDCFCCSGRYSI